MAVLAKICLDESLPIRELCPGLPADLEAALTTMLAKERAARPRDATLVEVTLTAIGERLERASLEPSGLGPSAQVRLARDTLTAGEQRVICVVLVTRPRPRPAPPPAPELETEAEAEAEDRPPPADARQVAETVVLPATNFFDEADFEGLRATLDPYGRARRSPARWIDGRDPGPAAARPRTRPPRPRCARCACAPRCRRSP